MTLDHLSEAAAFAEVTRLALLHSQRQRWFFIAGGLRCTGGRCLLEVAADVGRGEILRARQTLWPKTWHLPEKQALAYTFIAAADHGAGVHTAVLRRLLLTALDLTEIHIR